MNTFSLLLVRMSLLLSKYRQFTHASNLVSESKEYFFIFAYFFKNCLVR